jgi:hypothetical protein
MSEKSNPSFEKARSEALRVLMVRGGLTAGQVASLRLSQLHLATNTLVVEPDEFDPSSAAAEPATTLKLDSEMRRALIAWLVVRPDSANDHLFPGPGLQGLDAETIKQAAAEKKPDTPPSQPAAPKPPPSQPAAPKPPSRPAETRKPVDAPLPEPLPPRRPRAKEEAPPPQPPAADREQPQAVPLEEIESLRRRLAEAYDAWAPAVTPPPERTPPPPRVPAEPPADTLAPEALEEPAVWEEEEELQPVEAPPVSPERAPEVAPAGPVPEGETPAAVPLSVVLRRMAEGARRLWTSGAQEARLSYRSLAIGGAGLLLVLCCLGLAIAGASALSGGGLAGLLAGAPSPETPTPDETALAASATPPASPSPTATATATSTPSVTPSASATPSPAPTDTPASTPTPVIIVVTATPAPSDTPTATPEATNTPRPVQEPTATPAPAFKYPAPVLQEPENGGYIPGIIAVLKWQPVGDLAENEWYSTRLIFRQQNQLVYEGDRVKVPEWRIPDRLYYAADGPDLEYRWLVFVERDNSDGSTTQLSPESETFVFRWE